MVATVPISGAFYGPWLPLHAQWDPRAKCRPKKECLIPCTTGLPQQIIQHGPQLVHHGGLP